MFEKRVKSHHRGMLGKPVMASKDEYENFLKTSSPKERAGAIYFHVPFCDNICSFCSMNRTKLDGELDEYCEFLLKEIEKFSKFNYIKEKIFESIYFGGGTPTVFKEAHLEHIIKAINDSFTLSKGVEFSFESTLHNLNLEKLKLMESLGVNRFSVGIQTFNTAGRKFFGRVYDGNGAIKRLEKIRENFSGNLCIDIIYNYSNQSEKEALNDAKLVKSLGIDSASFYSLIYMESANLSKSLDESYYDLKTDKALHHAFLGEVLSGGEFEILEHTKVVRKNRDKYHYITLTHAGADILPLGVGSGGKVGNFGIFNMKKDMAMISKNSPIQGEFEKFSNLFQYDKISLNEVKSYLDDESFSKVFQFLKECEKARYLEILGDLVRLNMDGVFWGNSIASKVIELSKGYFVKQIFG